MLDRLFSKILDRHRLSGRGHRGRVHRVSIVQGGEVSVVLRFGVEEANARGLNQGALVELREIPKPAEATP